MYQVIPRKYRPKRFSEVVGHESVVTTLKNALRLGRIAQAYLFCGSRGTGKTTLARLFAKALNCSKLDQDGEPCNTCTSCKEILEGRSLDLIEIDGASNRGIDDIRQINETIGYAASSGKYKIYIIDEVHMLTKEAFNALLKTLEEPPPSVKFFFATTEPHKVLPTIISRCQRFELSRLPLAAIQEKLTRISQELKLNVEEAALDQIARLADGSLRDAESLLDQLVCFSEGPLTLNKVREALGLLPEHFFTAVDQAILSGDTEKARTLAEELYSRGKDPSAIIDALQEHFRTHLIAPKGPFTRQQCLSLLDLLLETEQQMSKSPFKRIHLEMLLIHLARSQSRLSLEQLIAQLLALENRLKSGPATPTENPKNEKASAAEIKVETPALKSAASNSMNLGDKSLELRKVSKSEQVAQDQAMQSKPIELKKEEKSPALPPAEVIAEKKEQSEKHHPSHYDTLLRFAAVELEGTIKRV